MASTHEPTGESTPEDGPESRGRQTHWTPSSIYQFQIALLQQQVRTLQTTLEQQRRRQQAIVDRYERVLERK